MKEDALNSIDKKLDVIIKLLAGNIVQGKSKTDAIIMLGAFGMDTNTIADVVGTTPATVATRLWEQKKGGTTKKKKMGAEQE